MNFSPGAFQTSSKRIKKLVFVCLFAFLGGRLFSQGVEASALADLVWHPYATVINEKSALNPDNFLEVPAWVNQATSSLWFDVYGGSFLQLSGNFEFSADTSRSRMLMTQALPDTDWSTLGDVTLGFDQLYLEWTTPNYWYLGYGKYPIRYGFSRVYSPLNYSSQEIDFQDSLGQWNAWFKGNIGPVNFALNYFPSIKFRDDPNDKTDLENFFSGLETALDKQMFSVHVSSFFFDSLDVSLHYYLQDKGDYAFDEFYMAGGGGFSWSIFDRLIWRGEALAGNGYSGIKVAEASEFAGNPATETYPQWTLENRDLDLFYPKVLTGFTFTLPGEIEVTTEYYYNGSGLTDTEREEFIGALVDSGEYYDLADPAFPGRDDAHKGFLNSGMDNWRIYDLGQHYVFLQILRLGLFQRMDVLNTSILLASDLSFFNITQITYNFSDRFSLGGDIQFFLFKEDGAYSLTPGTFQFGLVFKYSI